MDVALVEHPQDHIDGQQGRSDQDRFRRQGLLERLGGALKRSAQGHRRAELIAGALHRLCRLAERDAGGKVERQGGGGELALVADRERAGLVRIDLDEQGQGHRFLGQRREQVDRIEQRGARLQPRRPLDHHVIGVQLGEILGHLALADLVIDGRVDVGGRDAEPAGGVAVDGQAHRGGSRLLV